MAAPKKKKDVQPTGRYIPCPGNAFEMHGYVAFLEVRPCDGRVALHTDCMCGARIFLNGAEWYNRGVDAATARASVPPGMARDGRGRAI